MDRNRGSRESHTNTHNPNQPQHMELEMIHVAAAAIGATFGIGILGAKAAEATGRNPGAATPILVLAIILAALIEGVFIITAFAV